MIMLCCYPGRNIECKSPKLNVGKRLRTEHFQAHEKWIKNKNSWFQCKNTSHQIPLPTLGITFQHGIWRGQTSKLYREPRNRWDNFSQGGDSGREGKTAWFHLLHRGHDHQEDRSRSMSGPELWWNRCPGIEEEAEKGHSTAPWVGRGTDTSPPPQWTKVGMWGAEEERIFSLLALYMCCLI